MEQKSKKIDIKIIVIVIVVIIAVVEGIVIFASNSGTPKGLQAKDCIGTWKIANDNKYYMPTIILYQGGTGKGLEKDKESYHTISWEIKDNILNLTIDGNTIVGYTERLYYRK